jgi:endoglucanase
MNLFNLGCQSSTNLIPTWEITNLSDAFQDEIGGLLHFRIRCYAAKTGAQITVRASGGRTLAEGWDKTWEEAISEAAVAAGCTYTKTSFLSHVITVGESYVAGSDILITMNSIADEWTQTTVDGYSQSNVHLELVSGASVTSRLSKSNVISFWLYDSSQDPVDLKKMFLTVGANFIDEGDPVSIFVNMANIEIGTTFRLFCSPSGSGSVIDTSDWEETFADALGVAFSGSGYSIDSAYATTGLNANQAGVITVTEEKASDVIEVVWTSLADRTTDGQQQFNVFLDQVSDENIRLTGSIASIWVRDTSTEYDTTEWQVEISPTQPTLGDTVTYRIFNEAAVTPSSVTVSEVGDIVGADFNTTLTSALSTAVNLKTGLSYSNGVLTNTADWDGELTFTRTLSSSEEGTHGIHLLDPVDSYVICPYASCLPNYTHTVSNEFLCGVNLSGGEFSSTYPGTYSTDYKYPSDPENATDQHIEMDYWDSQGIDIIRLPVHWERIQREFYADLYDGDFAGTYSGAMDMARVDEIINYWTGLGHHIILDVHNYAKWYGVILGIGSSEHPVEAFCDLWERLANRYKDNDKVLFCLMNEPSYIQLSYWTAFEKACIAAVRLTGAKNKILISGVGWTGAHTWTTNGNSTAWAGYADPVGETFYDVHQYLDSDSSGTSDICVLDSNERIVAATEWAKENGVKLFLGEFNGGANTVCATEIASMLEYIAENKDAWLGWSAWGAGTRWGDYIFRLDPPNYTDGSVSDCWLQIKPYLEEDMVDLNSRYYVYFDGNSYIQIPEVYLTGAFKLEFNILKESDTEMQAMGYADALSDVISLREGGAIRLRNHEAILIQTQAGIVNAQEACKITITRDAYNLVSFYKNDVLVASYTLGGDFYFNLIGRYGSPSTFFVNGFMWDVFIEGERMYELNKNVYPSLIFKDSISGQDGQGYNFQESSFVMELP